MNLVLVSFFAFAASAPLAPDIRNSLKIESFECDKYNARIGWVGGNGAPIAGYIVKSTVQHFVEKSDEPQEFNVTVPANSTSVTIPVIPWSRYTFTVLAVNETNISLASEVLKCKTLVAEPQKNPANVTARATNSTTIVVTWDPIPKQYQNAPDLYYAVSWKADGPVPLSKYYGEMEAEQWRTEIIIDATEFIILKARPDTRYFIMVMSGNCIGPAKFVPLVFTLRTPRYDKTYNKNKEESSSSEQVSGFPYSDSGHVILDELLTTTNEGVHYLFDWFVKKKESAPNEEKSRLKRIPSKNPDNVTVEVPHLQTLVIRWKPMTKNECKGRSFYYKVSWKMDLSETEWEHHIIPECEKGEYTASVSPYEKHFVKVAAGNEFGESIQTPIIVEAYYKKTSEEPLSTVTKPKNRVLTSTTKKEMLPESTTELVIETTNDPQIEWVAVALAIVILIIIIVLLISIYLKYLARRGKYYVGEKENNNGRPDWPEYIDVIDLDEFSPPSNVEAPNRSSSPVRELDNNERRIITLLNNYLEETK